jgi:hypothetical protein
MAEGDGWRVKRGDFTAEHAETAERKTENRGSGENGAKTIKINFN